MKSEYINLIDVNNNFKNNTLEIEFSDGSVIETNRNTGLFLAQLLIEKSLNIETD